MIRIEFISPEQALALRKIVLRKNIDLPSLFSKDYDKSTFHLGLFRNQELVSIVSLMKNEHTELSGNQYQLRGMATHEKYRQKGFGKMILIQAEKILREKHCNLIWCNARVKALDFYRKQGFIIYGKEFNISRIGEHYMMFKTLQ
jgi:ribosomal protein S18 acetylase RimI-like enzyme